MRENPYLANCAIRPEQIHYLIFWTRPGRTGWNITHVWSPDPLHLVRECFHYDYYTETPTIVGVLCLSNN